MYGHLARDGLARGCIRERTLQQHKMVYDALEGRMGGILHALSLKTTVKKD